MFDFPTRRHPQRPPRLFVKTQGFEKRFFVQHFKKYFGDDVVWSEGTDMQTVCDSPSVPPKSTTAISRSM